MSSTKTDGKRFVDGQLINVPVVFGSDHMTFSLNEEVRERFRKPVDQRKVVIVIGSHVEHVLLKTTIGLYPGNNLGYRFIDIQHRTKLLRAVHQRKTTTECVSG